ncbi:tachykinin-3-like isoform X3 [Saccopteryx leptura]|uniref:tachykinin-3-like isoform X3 n=1 Tax=Saccopteryx leptura TaxID=249018 RepID=UPI00339BC750
MRSTLLLAAILALSLALEAVCEESQEQMVPLRGRREKVPDINQLLKTLTSSGPVSVDELLKTLGKALKGPKKRLLLQKHTPIDVNQEIVPSFGSLDYPRSVE